MVDHLSVLCGHSTLGLLLLLSGIQMFMTLALFPGIAFIFSSSIEIRSARTNVENTAKALDNFRFYQIVSAASYSTLQSNLNSDNSLSFYYTNNNNSNVPALSNAYKDFTFASQNFTMSMAKLFPNVNYPTSITINLFQTAIDPANNNAISADIYITPDTNFMLTKNGQVLGATTYGYTKIGSASFSPAQNISGSSVQPSYNVQKQITKLITTSMERTETLASFFIFQWIIGTIYFIWALRYFNGYARPGALPYIAIVGLVCQFFSHVCGFTAQSPWDLQTLLYSSYLLNSYSGVSSPFFYLGYMFGAYPHFTMLLWIWILMVLYSNYVVMNERKIEGERRKTI
eukprot:TRINITY_DN21671_c0_g1_i1.p1 TRINITY_DN21671_c0_g1~~TRINITY_DN21671_c0_g1_i1.p1  ORF type:complete len:344 (-),score=60.45 TRINITY_DN21671_c0_g1_i1:77-1108(-)